MTTIRSRLRWIIVPPLAGSVMILLALLGYRGVIILSGFGIYDLYGVGRGLNATPGARWLVGPGWVVLGAAQYIIPVCLLSALALIPLGNRLNQRWLRNLALATVVISLVAGLVSMQTGFVLAGI